MDLTKLSRDERNKLVHGSPLEKLTTTRNKVPTEPVGKLPTLGDVVKILCQELSEENLNATIELWKKEKIVIFTEEHSLYEISKPYWKEYHKNFVQSNNLVTL